MKHLLFYLSIALALIACKSDKTENEQAGSADLTWHTIGEVSTLSKSDKGYFIDVYTDWCGWCKKMDKVTFSDDRVKKAMAAKYHAIKFNAEQKESVNFNGKVYQWQGFGRNGVNGLAMELLQGELSFPSYVFLDQNFNIKKVTRGFMLPEDFLKEL